MTRLSRRFRQWSFPAELRIQDPGLLYEPVSLEILERLITGNPGADEKESDPKFAAKLATTVWRLRRQTAKLDESDANTGVKKRAEMLETQLEEHGIVIRDYTGQDLDENEIWDDVLGPSEANGPLYISGMRAPRVLLNGTVIQRGAPIVHEK